MIVIRDSVGVMVRETLYPGYVQAKPKPTVRPSRNTLNRVSTPAVERQLMMAADGAVIPLLYGRQRVGGKIAVVKSSGNDLYMLAIFALGECNAIEKILIDGEEKPETIVNTYLGTTTQLVDPILASLIPGYSDNLVVTHNGQLIGVCHAILKVAANQVPSQVEAIIQGRLVYDPRIAQTVYSTNPALCTADFISNDIYGQGRPADWNSVAAVADDNDELVGGLKRREINLAIDRMAESKHHVEALRAYAGCFVVPDTQVKLVSDRPAVVTRALTENDVFSSLVIEKSGTANLPTVIKVIYTDTTAKPWKDAEAVAEWPGATERRESGVPLRGITTYAQAKREAVERLNALHLSDLKVQFDSLDESLADQRGDVITLTHSKGLTAKPLRILDADPIEPGVWRIYAAEYDPLVYSDTVETEPTYPDTTIPSANNPLPPTNVQITEELFEQETKIYPSRLRITWDAPDYPFIQHYRVVVKVGIKVMFETTTVDTEIPTGEVLELSQHDVEVYVFSGLTHSAAATNVITPKGKELPPGDVPELKGYEAGGQVRLSWLYAMDAWKYEVRYGPVGVLWDDADLIDIADNLRLQTDEVAQGTWDFLVKALDSIGIPSVNEARKTITVTLDNDAFLVGEHQFNAPTLTSMHKYKLARSDTVTHAVSDSGQSWDSLFPNAMNTYVNPIHSYQNDVVSEYLSEVWDAGLELSGDWSAEIDYTVVSGIVTAQLELSIDNVNWDIYTNLSVKATARYARVRVKSNPGLFILNWPNVLARINAIPRTENNQATSLVTGGKTIQLTNDYAKAKLITITPLGAAARSYSIDNIDLVSNPNTFDVYIFDNNGNQVVNDFLYDFKGV